MRAVTLQHPDLPDAMYRLAAQSFLAEQRLQSPVGSVAAQQQQDQVQEQEDKERQLYLAHLLATDELADARQRHAATPEGRQLFLAAARHYVQLPPMAAQQCSKETAEVYLFGPLALSMLALTHLEYVADAQQAAAAARVQLGVPELQLAAAVERRQHQLLAEVAAAATQVRSAAWAGTACSLT